jgi:putative glutamine amidotransferase
MGPLIAITCDRFEAGTVEGVPRAYVEAVAEAGGVPVLVPTGKGSLRLEPFDGFLLPGGYDVDPAYFGAEPSPALGTVTPERDALELALLRAVLPTGRPVLGICRGAQVLAVALGGRLHQDIERERPDAIQHRQKGPRSWASHTVAVEAGTRLASALGVAGTVRVNSFHHQAVAEPLPAGLLVTARAPDGLVEAFEDERHPFCIGVQWHPEGMVAEHDHALRLFQAFVHQAEVARRG